MKVRKRRIMLAAVAGSALPQASQAVALDRRLDGRSKPASFPVVLGVTETACAVPKNNEQLLRDLTSACESYPQLSIILNVFDSEETKDPRSFNCAKHGESPTTPLPACIKKVTHVPGMKAAYWRMAVRPADIDEHAPGAEIVWLFDNDMRVSADHFNLLEATETLLSSNVSMAQPRVGLRSDQESGAASARRGSHALVASREPPPRERAGIVLSEASGEWIPPLAETLPLEPSNCKAQAVHFVEVQTPMLRAEAYRVLHGQVLNTLDMSIFDRTVWGIDHIWCKLFEQEFPHREGCAVLSTVITTSTNQFSTIASTGIGIHQRSVLGQAGCKWVSKRYDWLWPFPDSTDCNPPRLAGRKRFQCLSWGPGWG